MRVRVRNVKGLGLGLALIVVGASSAQAWTWASSSNPIVMSGGGGYGNVSQYGNKVTLQSWLRDTKIGDGRVYAHVQVRNTAGLYGVLDSGQRSDGEPAYARMADKSNYFGWEAYDFWVQTCRSTSFNDPCSQDVRRS